MPQGESGAAVSKADLAAFGVEMAMVVTLALGGWRLGSTRLVHITLAVVLPALAAVIWAVWMAPSSRRRLRDPERLVGQIALILATYILAAKTHLVVWGIVFGVVSIMVFVLTRRTRTGRGTEPR
jgi:hypothetical protein